MINRCNILLDFMEAHFFLLFEMLPTKNYSLGFYRYFASELTQNLATNQTDIYLYNSYESKTLVWLYLISTEPGSPCHQHNLTSSFQSPFYAEFNDPFSENGKLGIF